MHFVHQALAFSSVFLVCSCVFDQPLRRLLKGEMLNNDFQAVYVLTAEYLQKWALKPETDRVGF
jgi:hypothetical protein